MRRPFALIVAFLLIALLFTTLAAGTAAASIIAEIPLDKRVEISPGMYVHLMHISISDTTFGGSYGEDPSNLVFPILVYEYENHGTVARHGHLHVRFLDDQGQSYEAIDAGTFHSIQPGKKSIHSIEINIPKDRRLTSLTLVMGTEEQTFTLDYPDMPTPTATPGAFPASPKGNICISAALLPLAIIGAAWIGTRRPGNK